MWNRCVAEWLKGLRYEVECYDEAVRVLGDEDGDRLEVQFGRVCRLSVMFAEQVDRLRLSPVLYETLDQDLDDDVAMWRHRLRYTYCGEAEELLEAEDLISDCTDDAKDVENSISKPGQFPVLDTDKDEGVQVRGNRGGGYRTQERPQTVAYMVQKKKEESPYIQGLCSLEIVSEKRKIKITDNIHIANGQLELIDREGKINLSFKLGTKKEVPSYDDTEEVDVIDASKKIYRFTFANKTLAKTFHNQVKSSSASARGPWNQLLRLLKKRSSRDLLVSKGILKNEAVFGNELKSLCKETAVPEVITRIVELIEEPDNISSVGLYRASGNLAVVQHIRLEIDSGRWEVLDKYRKDVDVLAGTLKLFFRELKEPLIPTEDYEMLRPLARASPSADKTECDIDREITEIVDGLPEPNRMTLLFIIKHLLKVYSYKTENKMDLHNIAICWGLSLGHPIDYHDLVAHTAEFTAVTERLLECYSKSPESEKSTQTEMTFEQNFIHQVVKKMTSLIEAHLDVEGIYRKSGSATKIDKIMKILEMKDEKCLDEMDNYKSKDDIYDLCSALKKFVMAMREPLIPTDFLVDYCQICDTNEEVDDVRTMVNKLPQKNVLFLLMQHLRKVLEHEKTNKMSLKVMTGIWMTTLLRGDVKYNKTGLFHNLISLDEQVLPDLLPESEVIQRKDRESRYDNVDVNYDEVSGKHFDTKL